MKKIEAEGMVTRKCYLIHRRSQDENPFASNLSGSDRCAVESYVSFFQPNDRLTTISEWNEAVVGSAIAPTGIRSASASANGKFLAFCDEMRCYISRSVSPLVTDAYIPLTTHSSDARGKQGCCVQFSPSDATRVAVTYARDVRVFDLARSVVSPKVSPKPDHVKPLLTIAGAAAQASPVSFTFINDSPNLLLTSWDLSPMPYIRMVDMREGGGKSVRIWKSSQIHGLTSSLTNPNHVAGYSGSDVCMWDTRIIRQGTSGGDDGSVGKLLVEGKIEQIAYSVAKTGTIGVLSSEGIDVFRDFSGKWKQWSVTKESGIGAFVFSPSNDLVVMHNDTGAVSKKSVRKDPIPCFNPRSGKMESYSNTGQPGYIHTPLPLASSELYRHLLSVSEGVSRDSLVESLSTNAPREVLDSIDWALPDHVHLHTVQQPLSSLFASTGAEILRTSPGGFGLPFHSSPLRTGALELLLSGRDRELVLALLKEDWENVLRILFAEDAARDGELVRSVTALVVNGGNGRVVTSGKSGIVADIVTVVNRLRDASDRQAEMDALIANESVFVRAVLILCYVQDTAMVASKLATIADSPTTIPPTLKLIPLLGLANAAPYIVDYITLSPANILYVALVGLLLFPQSDSGSLPPVFHRAIRFLRDDLCNRLGEQCWSLRSLIDSIVDEDKSGGGSARMVCYYCNKPLCGYDVGGTVEGESLTRCPHRGCHKPLPSCGICLEPMSAGATAQWTLWCATCKHGGHQDHITEWFGKFEECPVAGCSCQCAAVDGF